ncbi:MAG: hypothetical protein DLM72_06910 [Candidatus Nitrosopolaris wilkensis]|nr:MAG: hypothetical protein DLM72_06910 [Candidatus Nitrosopolaris wilkensis]
MKKVWDPNHELYTSEKGKGILEYPFAVEFLVVPYKTSSLSDEEGNSIDRASKFIGSVNYSLSPRSNEFDGITNGMINMVIQ